MVVAGLQVLGWSYWGQGWQQFAGPVQEVGLEAVGAAEMEDFVEDLLQEKNKNNNHIKYFLT